MRDVLMLKTRSVRWVVSKKETIQQEIYTNIDHPEGGRTKIAVQGGTKMRRNALISITFADGFRWTGSVEELKGKLS